MQETQTDPPTEVAPEATPEPSAAEDGEDDES